MRFDDIFHGTRRRLGLGPWSRDYFERRFAVRDPWSYETSEYESTKYQRTLDAIPAVSGARILEVGCAEGVFTELLAQRGGHVLAVDISLRALSRAQRRCAAQPAVRFARFDIAAAPVIGTFDVAVCAEMLYYLHHRGLCLARDHIASAVKPGGHLVLVNPSKDAARIQPVFDAHLSLRTESLQTWDDHPRAYTIALLRRTP